MNLKFDTILPYLSKSNQFITSMIPQDIIYDLIESTSFLDNNATIQQRFYHIKHNILYKVTCCVCGDDIKYKQSSKYSKTCSLTCKNILQKNTCIEKYGTSTPLLNDNIINKIKQIKKDRYGDENYNNPTKCKSTKIKNHGTLNFSNKIKQTKKDRYGNENYNNINKIKQTNLDHYGVQWGLSTKEIQYKSRKTKKELYGDEHYTNRNKAKQTILERYFVNSPAEIHIPLYVYDKLKNYNWMLEENKTKTVTYIANELNVSVSMISSFYKKHNIKVQYHNSSKEENKISEFLDESNINYIKNDRKIISPKELDFYLPEHNLAIEVNGIYWHCEQQGKNKKYHLNKTQLCEENGTKLIHIYDNDINLKWDLIKSRLESQLGISNRIFARKCKIIEVSNHDSKIFLNENHIQGSVNSKYNYGLMYNNELVSLMTFGKARFSKADYELLRFCNKKGFSVIGGASRLFKKFINEHKGSIVSYADRNWSTGNLYDQLGFDFSHNSAPNYKYTKDYINLESRNKYMKHKLNDRLEKFEPLLTEYQNMVNNEYDRIWDSGNKVYLYT